MRNYPDSLCTYGYMTICDDCLNQAPRHVDTSQPIDNPGLPIVACELCDKPRSQQEKPMADPGLEWSEENQRLIERFLVLATGRNMCLAHTDRPISQSCASLGSFVDGQNIQNMLRELFDKPDLVISAWDWSDRDNS